MESHQSTLLEIKEDLKANKKVPTMATSKTLAI